MKNHKRLPLNSLEKFMLAHESEAVSYNSQIVVEFDGFIVPEQFRETIEKAVSSIPWLRTKIITNYFCFDRKIMNAKEIELSKTLIIKDYPITSGELDEFCKMKFDLKAGHCFTFLIAPLTNNRTQLIFNVHHTLCDAAGQFLFLEEIFRIMNGEETRSEALKPATFRYRDLRKHMGIKWFIKQIWDNRKTLKNQRQYKMATLIDHPEKVDRTVSSITFDLNEMQKRNLSVLTKMRDVSIAEYLTYASFIAYDECLRERGDITTPIMAYMPKTLRPFFKIRYSFQNILSTVLVIGKRDEIHNEKFLGKIKHIIRGHKVDQASKFIFKGLLPCSVSRPSTLKRIFSAMDNDPQSITSSMLISAGKVPRSYTFPNSWQNIRIWARGTMLKSPGIGIIYTGTIDHETITIEYVKELFEKETIELLRDRLIESLSPAISLREELNPDIVNFLAESKIYESF